jgi:hypothetical protein
MTFLLELASGISDNNICTWYYVLFLINMSVFVVGLLAFIWVFITNNKIFMKLIGARFVFWIVSMIITLTSALFFYLMCDRALLKN